MSSLGRLESSEYVLPPSLPPRSTETMIQTCVNIIESSRLTMSLAIAPHTDWQHTKSSHRFSISRLAVLNAERITDSVEGCPRNPIVNLSSCPQDKVPYIGISSKRLLNKRVCGRQRRRKSLKKSICEHVGACNSENGFVVIARTAEETTMAFGMLPCVW